MKATYAEKSSGYKACNTQEGVLLKAADDCKMEVDAKMSTKTALCEDLNDKSEAVPDKCVAANANETLEEYLERMKVDFDARLNSYKSDKSKCQEATTVHQDVVLKCDPSKPMCEDTKVAQPGNKCITRADLQTSRIYDRLAPSHITPDMTPTQR